MQTICDLIETDAQNAKRQAWSEYRALLERYAALAPEDKARLLARIKVLALTPADVQTHLDSLRTTRQHAATVVELAQARAEQEAHAPIMKAFVEKRQRILAELDREGGPIVQTAIALDNAVMAALNAATFGGHEELEYPDLYGVVPKPPAPPLSDAQYDEAVRRSRLKDQFRPTESFLRQPDFDRRRFDDTTNDVITEAFALGIANPEDFPPAMRVDPRRAKCMSIARRMRQAAKEDARTSNETAFPQDAKALVAFGVKIGWLKSDLSPVKAEDEAADSGASAGPAAAIGTGGLTAQ